MMEEYKVKHDEEFNKFAETAIVQDKFVIIDCGSASTVIDGDH
jgi:hypothetical protein